MFIGWICQKIRGFRRDRSGVTAIEYGLIAGVVGIVTATAMSQIGSLLSANYFNILASLF
jgi:Flp pilus assembly pilin Flp